MPRAALVDALDDIRKGHQRVESDSDLGLTAVVTPIKIGTSRSDKALVSGNLIHTNSETCLERPFSPPPSMEPQFSAILTPIKSRSSRSVGSDGVESPRAEVPALEIVRGHTLVDYDASSSGDDIFEDATDNWTSKDTDATYSKDKMTSLLENIDELVEKEKLADPTLEEDQRDCAKAIKMMCREINSTHKNARKAVLSPGAGFHWTKDLMETPLAPQAKGPKTLAS